MTSGADVAGFADDDAGAVVDEEAGADAGAGMDVDAGLGVGMLGHHARDQRYAEQQDLMGDAVNGDRLEAGIAEDDLVVALGGRVALEGGLDVLLQDQADVGQALEQLDGLLLGQGLEIHGHARLGLDAILLVAQGAGDLLGQLVVQAIDQVADVILNIADVQVLPPPVPGIEDVHQIAEDIDDGLATGQRFVAEMAGPAAFGVGGDDGFGDFGKRFFQTNISGHDEVPGAGAKPGDCGDTRMPMAVADTSRQRPAHTSAVRNRLRTAAPQPTTAVQVLRNQGTPQQEHREYTDSPGNLESL